MEWGSIAALLTSVGGMVGVLLVYRKDRKSIDTSAEQSFRDDVLKRLHDKEDRENILIKQVLELTREVAEFRAIVIMYQRCPMAETCPFRSAPAVALAPIG